MKLGAALAAAALVLSNAPRTAASEPEPPELGASMERLAEQIVEGIDAQGRRLTLPAGLEQVAGEVRALFPQQPLELLLIDDPRPNAQALPGGRILLNLGLLLNLESRAELLFVLAHEGAHIELEHFSQRINGSGSARSGPMELEADDLARVKLAQAGWSLDTIPDLLRRTRERQADARSPVPAAAFEDRWGDLSETVLTLQRQALERLLTVDRIDAADRFLKRHNRYFAPREVSRWRWMMAQRLSGSPADDRAIEMPDLGGPADAVPDRYGQCRPPEAVTNTEENGVKRSSNLGALRIPRPANWRNALNTGRQLVLTPDSSGLTRLDVWKAGTTPAGKAARRLPCASSRHTLWHAATEFRALEAGQKLAVIDAAETPQGVRLEMALTDESALRWRLTGWRLMKNGEAVYVLYRAPELHFFERHRQAAQMMAAGIEVNR